MNPWWTFFVVVMGGFLVVQGAVTVFAWQRVRRQRMADERHQRSEKHRAELWRLARERRQKESSSAPGGPP